MKDLEEYRKCAVTRVETEIIEDVTNIVKTYLVGERSDSFQSFNHATINTANQNACGDYQIENTSADSVSVFDNAFSEKNYVSVLRKQSKTRKPKIDTKFQFEDQCFENYSKIQSHEATESNEERKYENFMVPKDTPSLHGINVYIECKLRRTEDYSSIEINVAVPHVFSAVLSLIYERLPQLSNHVTEKEGKKYADETTIQYAHHFDYAGSFEDLQQQQQQHTTIEKRNQPSFLFEKPEVIQPVKIPALIISKWDLRKMADTSAILANFVVSRTDYKTANIVQHDVNKENYYRLEQQGQHYKDEIIINKKQYLLTSESVKSDSDEKEKFSHADFIKQEARGEFEVTMKVSSSQRSSPLRLNENYSVEDISVVAQISTDGRKEEIVTILPTKIDEVVKYTVKNIDISVLVQKAMKLDEILQQHIQNWNATRLEKIAAQFREHQVEQAVIMCGMQSETSSHAECTHVLIMKPSQKIKYHTSAIGEEFVQIRLKFAFSKEAFQETDHMCMIPNILCVSFTCAASSTEKTVAVIYMQKKITDIMMFLSCDEIRRTLRISDGHILTTKETKTESTTMTVSIGYIQKYANELQSAITLRDMHELTSYLRVRESCEVEYVSNLSLSKGTKMLITSTHLATPVKYHECYTVKEFGEAMAHVAVMLQRGGVSYGNLEHNWPQALAGKPKLLTFVMFMVNTLISLMFFTRITLINTSIIDLNIQ
ncbi:unnamed protein product [Thelazia callipaeda]|uniref:PIH1 domain-containing protein 1 n=1 Tax=Thelazia callipaeda TaxID=103827 RepID=A0A0N5CVF1_THECL|nr:unnamed protein product [Thelazia callipaeda]